MKQFLRPLTALAISLGSISITSVFVSSGAFATTGTVSFSYPGSRAAQTFTVPDDVSQITVSVRGGDGSGVGSVCIGGNFGHGGSAALVTTTLNVSPGQRLSIYVANAGSSGNGSYGGSQGGFGYENGGKGDPRGYGSSGGGGSSAIIDAQNGSPLVIAGGGGGGGRSPGANGGNGGFNGTSSGGDGSNNSGSAGSGGSLNSQLNGVSTGWGGGGGGGYGTGAAGKSDTGEPYNFCNGTLTLGNGGGGAGGSFAEPTTSNGTIFTTANYNFTRGDTPSNRNGASGYVQITYGSTFTGTYDVSSSNQGTVTEIGLQTASSSIAAPAAPTNAPTGTSFLGWNTNLGGVDLSPGSTVALTSDLMFIADWGTAPARNASNVSHPVIAGNTFASGDSLTVSNGSWTNNLSIYAYSWYICAAQPSTGVDPKDSPRSCMFSGNGSPYSLPSPLIPGYVVADVTTFGTNGIAVTSVSNSIAVAPTLYTVSYNSGSTVGIVGSAPVDTNHYNLSDTVTLPLNASSLRLPGYLFAGWCAEDDFLASTCDDNGSTFPDGTYIMNPYQDNPVIFYAIWDVNPNGITTTYTLTYAANSNGTISGTVIQSVESGFSGTTITAIASAGYHFVSWSDNSTSNPRTDSNVVADVNVMATFAINPVVINYSKPSAPSNVTASLSNGTATVSFTPGSSGNLATYDEIDMYINGQLVGNVCNVTGATSCPISNLGPDAVFSFTVTAINSKGSAVSSVSNTVSYSSPVVVTTTTTSPPTTTTTVPPVKRTITCVKGKTTKKITALSPVCPAGYKRK